MFSYRCRRCGKLMYSSANESTVGRCSHCDGSLVPAPPLTRKSGPEHMSAVRRLAAARGAQSRLDALQTPRAGTGAQTLALERLSAGRANVAARQEWLHWIDEGESLAPWADGDWAPNGPTDPSAATAGAGLSIRFIEERIRRGEDNLRRAVAARAVAARAEALIGADSHD
jgi:hypothetical protein